MPIERVDIAAMREWVRTESKPLILVPVGFDYDNQAWIANDKYTRCGHPDEMNCQCYGRLHEGETPSNEVLFEVSEHEARIPRIEF
jgi:hypothetical protein